MIQIIIFILCLACIAYFAARFATKKPQDLPGAVDITLGRIESQVSDRIVVISGLSYAEVEKLTGDFIKQYSQDKPLDVRFELSTIDSRDILVRFSDEITFDVFCFYVNYAQYPVGDFAEHKVIGWSGLQKMNELVSSKDNIPSDLGSKNAMFYLSPNDSEYDQIWFVTDTNENYVVSFAYHGKISPSSEQMRYLAPKIYEASNTSKVMKFKSP